MKRLMTHPHRRKASLGMVVLGGVLLFLAPEASGLLGGVLMLLGLAVEGLAVYSAKSAE